MLADLLAHRGVVEESVLAGAVGFMALHGGIESGTADLARSAAGSCGASLYVVEVPDDLWWHVPSTRFDPADSPPLAHFVRHVDRVVSIHGFGRPETVQTALIGGRNRAMARRLAADMRRRLAATIIDEVEAIPRSLRGLHPRNPVNLPPSGGVQVELTEDLREGPALDQVVAALVDHAVREMNGG